MRESRKFERFCDVAGSAKESTVPAESGCRGRLCSCKGGPLRANEQPLPRAVEEMLGEWKRGERAVGAQRKGHAQLRKVVAISRGRAVFC